MIYKNFNKPSKNMLLTNYEVGKMTEKLNEELYRSNSDNYRHIHEAAENERQREEYASNLYELSMRRSSLSNKKAKFLESVKEAFLMEAMVKLYNESYLYRLNDNNKSAVKNMIVSFIKEHGAGNLICSFSTKNIVLSEIARVVDKYYNKVLESTDKKIKECDCTDPIELNLDKTIADDFFKELETLDYSDASNLIKERVADAIQQFIDYNYANKLEYEDIIKTTQENINASHSADETVAEQYSMQAKRKINEMKLMQNKSIFNILVENFAHKVITNKDLRDKYTNSKKVIDMDKIVEDAQIVYTMLEMINTTNMIKVNESTLTDYLNS